MKYNFRSVSVILSALSDSIVRLMSDGCPTVNVSDFVSDLIFQIGHQPSVFLSLFFSKWFVFRIHHMRNGLIRLWGSG